MWTGGCSAYGLGRGRVVTGSTRPAACSGPTLAVVDFQGIAGLIDTVLGAAPERLDTLLRALATSNERLEARVVVELVLRARDPLAPLATLCRDALKAAADLDLLLTRQGWQRLEEVCSHGRATAILNLCDVTIAQANPHGQKRRERIQEIRPRVRLAAVAELKGRRNKIDQVRRMREAALPNLWKLIEAYVAKMRGTSDARRWVH